MLHDWPSNLRERIYSLPARSKSLPCLFLTCSPTPTVCYIQLTIHDFRRNSKHCRNVALKAGDADDGLPFRRWFRGHSLSRLEWALNQCLNSWALTKWINSERHFWQHFSIDNAPSFAAWPEHDGKHFPIQFFHPKRQSCSTTDPLTCAKGSARFQHVPRVCYVRSWHVRQLPPYVIFNWLFTTFGVTQNIVVTWR